VWLNEAQARCVAESIAFACEKRTWRILRAAIMSNHVHVVIADCPDDGPEVRRVLKGVSQSSLSKLRGCPGRWWTRDGSNRYLHGADSIEAAVRYVTDQQHILA